MNIEIRDYNDKDLEGVNKVLNSCFSREKKCQFDKKLFKEIVAVIDGNVCGYVLLYKIFNPIRERYFYYVNYVCVDEKYRGEGIAYMMMEYAYELAKKDDCMYLELTCSYHRVAAHRLYESLGYIKRESDIYRKELV